MTRTDRMFVYAIFAAALPIIILLVIFVSPRDPAIMNQTKLIRLLATARPDVVRVSAHRIERVILANRISLMPERDQVAVGYVLRAHMQESTFTIEARPVQVGKTGLFSYFRDEAGVIRFEMGAKNANAESRPWNQPPP